MENKRKMYSSTFKGKVALEAAKEIKTINVLASEYGVHPNQIGNWKKRLKEGIPEIFNVKRGKSKKNVDMMESKLYEEIGRLKIELDWLKKKLT